ncbi:cytochrome p450 [Stemphylium lycopersici]|nr:cytochrome p450 [Stemphylium lycopersici]
MALSIYLLVIALVAATLYRLGKVGRRPPGCPPGPPTLPILGNIHLIPKEKAYVQFQKWAEEYGPVYSVILGTKVMIVLSSDQAVKDLLDKRSGIYSSRPEVYLGNIVSNNDRMLLMPYGDKWRMVRKIVHNALNINVARTYIPYQELEAMAMLVGVLEAPELFIDQIRRYTNSLTTQMIFGFRTSSINDPKLLKLYSTFTPCFALYQISPFHRANTQSICMHKDEKELYLGHWLDAKKAIRDGIAKPCFCVDVLRAQDEEHFSDSLAAYMSGSLLEAGSDTTAAELIGFVQAMLLFPDIAKSAQEELDRVCGPRLPTLDDWPNLPYINGCIKETLRWMPTAILGMAHAAIRDDEYMGYRIPKGAGVIANVWAIHNDAKRHPDPRRFDPTRYANDQQSAIEAANNPDPSKRDNFVFGNGRRICQGMHIAERSLFFAISRMLWAFDFGLACDKQGREVIPDPTDLPGGFLVQPRAFPARITPREEKRCVVIREEWEKMRGLLDEEEQWRELPKGLVFKDYHVTEKLV